MKKRIFALVLALVCYAALPITARADVLYTPMDSFYDSHWGECDYVNRGYTANGPGGELTLYTSPENSQVKGTVENGEGIYVSVTYTDGDGVTWGCAEHWDKNLTGWVPMDYLVKIYNSDDFWNEFGDRILEETGTLEPSAEPVYFWSYPGSKGVDWEAPLEGEYLPEYGSVFVDDAGRKWAHINYYMGARNCWVCLDNPTADYDTLYAEHAPQRVTKPEIVEPSSDIRPGGIPSGVIIGLAAAVAVVSAAALYVMKKPTGKKKD